MRIIAGKYRGRKLKAPKGLTTRPVLARVREALFTVLGDVSNFRVLDLYAGTGAIGIEALSLGAGSLTAIDSGFQQVKTIRENLSVIQESTEVIRSDVIRALKSFRDTGQAFDLIFADPPYERGLALLTVNTVAQLDILSAKGVLAVTVRHTEILPEKTENLSIIFNRRYGDSRLIIYKNNEHEKTEPDTGT